jgi:excisionase family DNA binding protein
VRSADLLSVGEAAILLRASRQHVVALCAKGLLPYVVDGSHKRIRRSDVEAFMRPALTRAQVEQLWLHQAVAGKFVTNPAALIARAAMNLRRLRRLHPEGSEWQWLDRWQAVLDEGPDAVLDALTSSSRFAVEMRRMSPFVGVLSEVERRTVMDALAEIRRHQARPVPMETVERVMRAV